MTSAMMRLTLLADIGGSTSRFAVTGPDGRPAAERSFDNDEVASLEDGLRQYLDGLPDRPEAAVLAVAGPVREEGFVLTNRPDWALTCSPISCRS